MSYLTAKDYKLLLGIIDIIYSVKDRNVMLQAVCKELESLMPISSAVYMPADLESGALTAEDHYVYQCNTAEVQAYTSYYAPQDPLVWSGHLTQTRNKAATYTDFIPVKGLKETEFVCDFLSRVPLLYAMGAMLGIHDHAMGVLGLHRQARDTDFNVRDKEVLNRILPHLSRALLDSHHVQPTMGVILLDENRCPLYMNEVAERVTQERSLSELLEAAATKQTVRTKTGGYSVITVYLRGSGEAVMFLSGLEDTIPIRAKLSALCLTPRQQGVVVYVLQGLSNQEIAERLFISQQTVKDHLHDIYKKLKVHNRCALMARVVDS